MHSWQRSVKFSEAYVKHIEYCHDKVMSCYVCSTQWGSRLAWEPPTHEHPICVWRLIMIHIPGNLSTLRQSIRTMFSNWSRTASIQLMPMLKPMTAALKQNISCHPINLHFADWKELRNHSANWIRLKTLSYWRWNFQEPLSLGSFLPESTNNLKHLALQFKIFKAHFFGKLTLFWKCSNA